MMKKTIIAALAFAVMLCHGDNIGRKIQKEIDIFNKEWMQNPGKYDIKDILLLFNLDYAGMEKVKKAVQAKDWDSAEEELLAYFKNTRGDNYRPVKLRRNDQEFADKALLHKFRGNKTYPPIFRGVKIDWRSEAVLNGKTINDREWLLQFNRLTWWTSLANVYGKTNNESYFYEWRYELVDYMKINLPITKKTPWPIRRGMETYDRCLEHIAVFPSFIRSSNFDSKTLRYFLSSFHQQAEHIRTMYSKLGNHLVGELNAIYRCGLAFPEFKKAQEWRNDALTRFPKLMFSEMYEDGMNKELIFSYHGMYVMLFANFYKLLKKHNHEVKLPGEYIKRLKKACDIMMYQTFPDWTSSQFGDAWKGDGSNWFYRLYACPTFPDNPYYKFMKTRGKKGSAPPTTSIAYPISGFYFFRSDWTKDAVFMSIKCGEAAYFHNQIDNGTFELYAYGRNFMNDSGCYLYKSSKKEDNNLRDWFRSTKVHQTMTLNLKNIKRIPKFLLWSDSKDLTTLSFENKSYENLTHRRTVLFIKKKYFLIYDEALGSAQGDVRIHYQLVPCKYTFNEKDFSVKTDFPKGANLLVKCFPQQTGMSMAKEKGMISYKQRQKEKRPAWSYMLKKKAAEKEISFLTALIPYKNTQSPVLTAKVKKTGNSTVFEFSAGKENYKIKLNWQTKRASIINEK